MQLSKSTGKPGAFFCHKHPVAPVSIAQTAPESIASRCCIPRCDNGRMELIIVSVASLFAGFVDSIVGGGGLILIPALFATFPNAHPATLFGTNKGASVCGTAMASWQYSRQVRMRWAALLPAAGAGLLASFAGAWLVTVISPDFLRKLLPFVLLLVLLYTLAKKELGRTHAPSYSGLQEQLIA